jgi:hypothetical protein
MKPIFTFPQPRRRLAEQFFHLKTEKNCPNKRSHRSLQLPPGTNARLGNRLRDSHNRNPAATEEMDLTRSAGDQQDDKTVEPGVLETCNTEQALEAAKLVRTRARRIPSSAQSNCSTRGRIHLRGPSVSFIFRLQHGDGPYIPYRPPPDRKRPQHSNEE